MDCKEIKIKLIRKTSKYSFIDTAKAESKLTPGPKYQKPDYVHFGN
jgi:hypothetical protein